MTGGISEVYGSLDGMGLAALVKSGEVSASEVLEEAIRRAEAVNGTLNFLTYKAYEEGRKMAADPALPDGPFRGVPWLVKEIATDWEGLQNTNACPYFKDVVSTSDNEQVKRVKKAGFVLLGKSNSPEAGWALSAEPKMYGPTLNPWDTTRTPGGSSGGSAAAVAARVLPLAEASDGGGSIRTPACHSGLVGLKPARGRITMAPGADFWYGGVTFLCVSRSVRDTAAYFDTVGGPMPGDPYYAVMPETPYLDEIGKDPGSLSIAMVTASPEGCTPVDAEVREGIENTGSCWRASVTESRRKRCPTTSGRSTTPTCGSAPWSRRLGSMAPPSSSATRSGRTRPRTSTGRPSRGGAAPRRSIITTTSRSFAPRAATSLAAWPPTMRG